mmetsp:Transcript_69643/g.203845  ORF Transcript_69643/g.203845 Transcript_69643/m.203845 type:complete len:228 (+) Transcript_69643:875-1558(+)
MQALHSHRDGTGGVRKAPEPDRAVDVGLRPRAEEVDDHELRGVQLLLEALRAQLAVLLVLGVRPLIRTIRTELVSRLALVLRLLAGGLGLVGARRGYLPGARVRGEVHVAERAAPRRHPQAGAGGEGRRGRGRKLPDGEAGGGEVGSRQHGGRGRGPPGRLVRHLLHDGAELPRTPPTGRGHLRCPRQRLRGVDAAGEREGRSSAVLVGESAPLVSHVGGGDQAGKP